jgi:outer membrane immunogenic protein
VCHFCEDLAAQKFGQSHFRAMIMKRVIFGRLAISALLIAAPFGAARAADLPAKSYAPAPTSIQVSWTACYIGGNAGEAWAENSNVVFEPAGPNTIPLGTASGAALAYGGQIGCDYQVNSNWVIGARAMFDGTKVKGSSSGSPLSGGVTSDVIFDFTTVAFATAVGRVGYLLTPTLLFYGLGGVAAVQDQYAVSIPIVGPGTIGIASETRTGWDAGLGVSWMFNPNFDLWFEYNYMGFGGKDVEFTGVGAADGSSFPLGISQTLQKILVGVDYRFGMAR